mmetsp:Transcript_5019/g.7537  ORF Transcript_5019/g.7537 Transcript_5019/m.7537 type:complete len:215 (+) Transcript_5019:8333-8977(+)
MQMARMRKGLFEKKIAREAKKRKKREEEEAKRKAEEAAEAAAKAAQTNSFNTTKLGGFGATSTSGTQEAGEDLLRLLLKKWAERVDEAKDDKAENVWEKQTHKDEAPPKGQEEEVIETGVLADPLKPIDYTLKGLWDRMRKIEKLTSKIRHEEDMFQYPAASKDATSRLKGSSSGMLHQSFKGNIETASIGSRASSKKLMSSKMSQIAGSSGQR